MLYFSKFPEVKQKMSAKHTIAIIELLQYIGNRNGLDAMNQEAEKIKQILATGKTKEAAHPDKVQAASK